MRWNQWMCQWMEEENNELRIKIKQKVQVNK